ncbi:myosin phosphatase Rho-interacting protein isoform X2 [Ambystoma mexicanum]|uniref:myosin phosphatase Rho-interacting protein isoform X2 n=1 Tax=Ambystoma mexicanum TaxID=8296 RepID=UPI0037E8FB37
MSSKDNPCRKFQANIFNKSKCQNCFKPRESHLLNDEDLNQAKPIYGGWLLLAPEGTDFDNPVHRSRKWQRRFFILYEHGLLRYALDEMPTTLPQGTINMNQCTDVVDGESRTGQKFSLCIITPEKEHFIRVENKEIINGWLEMLIVYPRTNKQNQKKKRKVEPPTPQEPGPAKVAVTSSSSIPNAEKVPSTKSTLWQEELRSKDLLDGGSSPSLSPVQIQPTLMDPPSEPMTSSKSEERTVNDDRPDCGRKARVESGYFSLEKTKPEVKPEDQQSQSSTSPSSPSTPSNRYSYSEPLSPEYSDPFPPPGKQFYRRPTISSSLSSLDSELSSTTQTSTDGREAERPVRAISFRAARQYATLADIPRARRISNREAFQMERKRLEQKTRARSPGREEVERLFGQQRRRSQVIEKFEALDIETAEQMETSCTAAPVLSSETRQGRSEKRVFPRKRDYAVGTSLVGAIPDVPASPVTPYRRAKSLDRRASESSMTPDLLNFKKGWLTKLYEDGQWKKHWFVLTDKSLRYYRDSVAEEASDIDGEIDLSTCYDVTEIPVQRNYGFQIHTKEGEFTLSAMTSGIRKNWIQTIMKHVRPATAPDVTSSLPEEKSKTTSAYEACSKLSDKDSEQAGADVEQKRSRARERRREGRSKTFDWAEFRPIQQAMAQERAKAAESCRVNGTSSKDKNGSDPEVAELERERTRRREERRKRFEPTDAIDGSSVEDISRMEVDRVAVPPSSMEVKPQNVQVEIEQRWHQVETTPLREEKQVPIAPIQLPTLLPSHGGLPSEKLASLLEKELEQNQKEVSQLLEQNHLLQDRLKEALNRQQSARDGYVLQTEVAASSSGSWERLHKVNEDLQNELEAQCRRQELLNQQIQAIRLSYGEAKDIIRHHEAEAQSLQARLSSAAAELSIKEQSLAKLKSDLKTEKDKAKEQQEEWQHTETMLNSQLQSSELKLKQAEALLLEKTQELRDLELQQALQRDHQKEMQRLQERLADVSGQLLASEKARILTEEKLQKNYEILLESGEKEKQVLLLNLKETEDKVREYEQLLQDDEQQMEVLQKEKLNVKLEGSEIVHVLEEKLEFKEASIQKLTGCIRGLEEERDRLICRCQEMMNQVTESDSEVGKLQTRLKLEESDYCNLENAFEKVCLDFRRMHRVLKEKEDELKHVKEGQAKVVERKDQDINEALIKMAALGNSLEETESKLQDALRKLENCSPESNTRGTEVLGSDVDACEHHISNFKCLAQPLSKLHNLSYTQHDGNSQESNEKCKEVSCTDHSSLMELSEGQAREPPHKAMANQEISNIGAKRQRIRFSNIHFQKYVHTEGSEKNWASSISSETSHDRSLSEESASSEPSDYYFSSGAGETENHLSVIQSLETKLYIAEEKLKDITLKLECQKSQNQDTILDLHSQWTKTESQLRDQLQSSLTQVNTLTKQLEEQEQKLNIKECSFKELEDFHVKKDKVLSCLKTCRKKLTSMLTGEKDLEVWFLNLSSMEANLSSLIQFLQKVPSSHVQCSDSSLSETQAGEHMVVEIMSSSQNEPQLSGEDKLRLLSEKLAFESSLLDRIAGTLKNLDSGVSQAIHEIHQTAELFSVEPLDSSMTITDVLANKLHLENEFWSRVYTLSKDIRTLEKEVQEEEEVVHDSFPEYLTDKMANCTLIKAELSFAAQKMKEAFHEKLKTLESGYQNNMTALFNQKCILEEIIKAYRNCDSESIIPQISKILEIHKDVLEINPTLSNPAFAAQCSLQDEIKLSHHFPESRSKALISCKEELAQDLSDKASTLRHINKMLLTVSPEDCIGSYQRILEVSHRLSEQICLMKPEHYTSFLVHDAVLQTQLWYAICKIRLEYERELTFYKDAWRNTDTLCKEQANNLAGVGQEYQEMLQKQQAKYSEIISIIQRENEELDNKASQLDSKERDLKEVETKHRESMLELKYRYEEEIRDCMEKLTTTEDNFKAERLRSLNKLDAVVQDRDHLKSLYKEQIQALEVQHHFRVQEQQHIHEQELQALSTHYIHSIQDLQEKLDSYKLIPSDTWSSEEGSLTVLSACLAGQSPKPPLESDAPDPTCVLKERIKELETQLQVMKMELEHKQLEFSASTLSEKYQKDFENLKATCERGFAAMEETHQKKIEDLQRQHQRELEKLREEKERLLDEETAATISAIEAMKNAHREEMERELEKTQRSQISSVNADIDSLRRQYLEELQSVQRELEVLSEQYSQKCLENAHLAQALEAERQALRQCQRENQELNAHNQELNNRLAAEFTRLRMLLSSDGGGEGAGSPLTQGKDAYELEVLLRVKESEIQYQKQEISSLKDELQSALRDKKYASDKYKDMYTELSIVKAKADCDLSRLKEQLKAATEALGEKSPDNSTVSGYDIMKSKSNPDFLKKDRACVNRQLRNIRSKSLKEGLTVQERMKLFETKDLKKH